METEIWKDIPGYEGLYRICSIGNVIERYIKKGYYNMKLFNNGGYLRIGLSKGGVRKKYLLHRLKAITFIPNQENKPDINHIDGNKLNNELSNLEWCSHKENIIHAYQIGLMKNNHYIKNHPDKGKFGKNNNRSKLVFQISKEGKLIKKWYSISDAKRELKIKGIYSAVRGLQTSAGGFVWKYPRDLLAALLMVRERELRKKDMETLDDYIKVIKDIDSAIVSELTSLLK